MKLMKIYRVTNSIGKREPIKTREEFGEVIPPHADMLRYDGAFCDPADVSRVIFPIVQHKGIGRSSAHITRGRWHSFSMDLSVEKEASDEQVGHWITYHHGQNHELVQQTLDEHLLIDKVKIVGWR